ncbi:unnamed protein product [Rhodiola kirilowii]
MNGTLAALPSTKSLFFSPPIQLPSLLKPTNFSTSIKSSVQTYTETTARKSRPSSLYEVLRVSRNATPAQIKSAYRTLAKKYHPDACSQSFDAQDFMEINKAYLTLSDPASRAMYDMKLGYSGRVAVDRSGFYQAGRRWETDQCW